MEIEMSDNNQNDVENEVDPSHLSDLEQAVKGYDCVIDISSVVRLRSHAWDIYGDLLTRYDTFRGRPVAFVGAFKSGKTWIIGQIVGSQMNDSPNLPTPGLCIKIPSGAGKKKQEKAKEPEKVESIDVSVVQRKTRGPQKASRASLKNRTQETEEVDSSYIIAMDTAGTTAPCHADDLKDARATEHLLRDLIVLIAPQTVFVTAKFDQPAQIAIQSLCTQLSHDPVKAITPQNKLIVVHNLKDITNQRDLEARILKVKDSYVRANGSSTPNSSSRLRLATSTESWNCILVEGFKTYETRVLVHIFLVHNDCVDGNWSGKEHNAAAIVAIRRRLEMKSPEDINLLESVAIEGTRVLSRYIKDWHKDKLRLFIDKEEHRIIPVNALPEVENSTAMKEERILPYEEGALDQIPDDWWEKEFQLSEMVFTDTGVLSDTEVDLEGQTFYNEEKIVIQVKTPGLNEQHLNDGYIEVITNLNQDKLVLVIALDSVPGPSNMTRLYTSFKTGVGRYSITFDNIRYKSPESLVALFQNHLKIADGILELTLQRQKDWKSSKA